MYNVQVNVICNHYTIFDKYNILYDNFVIKMYCVETIEDF